MKSFNNRLICNYHVCMSMWACVCVPEPKRENSRNFCNSLSSLFYVCSILFDDQENMSEKWIERERTPATITISNKCMKIEVHRLRDAWKCVIYVIRCRWQSEHGVCNLLSVCVCVCKTCERVFQTCHEKTNTAKKNTRLIAFGKNDYMKYTLTFALHIETISSSMCAFQSLFQLPQYSVHIYDTYIRNVKLLDLLFCSSSFFCVCEIWIGTIHEIFAIYRQFIFMFAIFGYWKCWPAETSATKSRTK